MAQKFIGYDYVPYNGPGAEKLNGTSSYDEKAWFAMTWKEKREWLARKFPGKTKEEIDELMAEIQN